MTASAGLRGRLSRRGAAGPGVLLLLLFNLAVEPCAASDADHDCPHCPPVEHHEMAAHHGHHGSRDHGEAENPCASMQPECCDLDEANVNARPSQAKVKDQGEQPVAVIAAAPWLDTIKFEFPVFTTGPPVPAAASPPIHLLNCVFLD